MKKKIILGVSLLLIIIAAILFINPVYYWIANNVGRWHIVILHFPIGLLACAWLMEILVRLDKFDLQKSAVQFVLFMGASSAVFAAVSGLILKAQGGYEPELIGWHQWLGIAATVGGIVTLLLSFTDRKSLYFVVFTIQVFLLIIAGHFGGSLTHGEGFLTENLTNTNPPEGLMGAYVPYEEATVWDDVIQPIFESKCISCHNPSKKKGGLVLTDSTSIMKGGNRGSIFDANSEVNLCKVLDLALEEELHMPPKGKLQVTLQERQILCWWSNSDVPFAKKISEAGVTPQIEEMLKKQFKRSDPIDLLGIGIPEAGSIASLIDRGVRIQSNGPESSWISVNFSDKPKLKEADLEVLDDLIGHITKLDLGNSRLDANIIKWVVGCEQLKVLKLDQCKVTKDYLETLSELAYLEELNLYRAKVNDNVSALFGDFKSLKRLYLWDSSLSASTVKKIKSKYKNIAVVSEDPGLGFPAQKIASPHFTTDELFFKKGTTLPLANVFPTAKIYYTLDGSEPTKKSKLFTTKSTFRGTCRIKARAFLEGWDPSDVTELTLVQKENKKFTVKNRTKPDGDYGGVSENGLIDGKIGEAMISDEQWTGYFGNDLQVTLDLEEVKLMKGVAFHSLEDVKSWVLFPSGVKVEAGESLSKLKMISKQEFNSSDGMRPARMDAFHVDAPCQARYVRITISSFGKLPEWHDSAGEPSWLFVDELVLY